jgi:arginase
MRDVRLLAVPYDSGHRRERQGLGPPNLVKHWLASAEGSPRPPEVVWVEQASEFPTELATSFELMGQVADEVRRALNDGRFPLVLAGNCNTSALGGAAGLRLWDQGADLGVVWFDAHGDFNTPEIDPHGFLDGQGLAILTGRCWRGLARRVSGFEPLADSSVMLIGAHDLDDDERIALAHSDIAHITPSRMTDEGVEAALGDAVEALAKRATRVYVHIDLDVIDADHARANSYASRGGLVPEQLFEAMRLINDRLPIAAAGLAAYDPSLDEKGRLRNVATQLLDMLRQPTGTLRPR